MPQTAPQVVGLGLAVLDILLLTEQYPTEDLKCETTATLTQGGGPCATALVAAAKMGLACSWCGALGNDAIGSLILEDFARYGVDTATVRRVPGAASSVSVVISAADTGSRTCIWDGGAVTEAGGYPVNNPASAKATGPTQNHPVGMALGTDGVSFADTLPDYLPEQLLATAQLLHLDGHNITAALPAAKRARALGIPISLDAGSARPGMAQLLPFVDILACSERFALAFTGLSTAEEALQALHQSHRFRLLAITQGPAGGLWMDDGTPQRYPDFAVQTVDSNGAGDVFHGALLAALLRNMPHPQALAFASAAAAIKCGRQGARTGAPGFDETLAWMETARINRPGAG